jgi:hypothetical protein
MLLIKIGQRIVNLDNVKFVELIKTDEVREIRFYFVDGSFIYFNTKNNEDREFDVVWEYLNGLWAFSTGAFIK